MFQTLDLASDRGRVVDKEVSRTANRVIRVSDLGRWWAGREGLVGQSVSRPVSEMMRCLQVRTVIMSALLPPQWSSNATVAASLLAADTTQATELAQHTAVGIAPAIAVGTAIACTAIACTAIACAAITCTAIARAAITRTAASAVTSHILVQAASGTDQHGGQRSDQ